MTVGGHGVRLGPSSGVNETDLFVAIDVDGAGVDSLVRMASGVRREWLDPKRIVTKHEIEYDESSDKLTARKRTRFADLILDDVSALVDDEFEDFGFG